MFTPPTFPPPELNPVQNWGPMTNTFSVDSSGTMVLYGYSLLCENTCSQSEISLTFSPSDSNVQTSISSPGDQQINLNYIINAGAIAGTHTVCITTPYPPESCNTFIVGDGTPVISSVSPSTWAAGASVPIVISGSNFGTAFPGNANTALTISPSVATFTVQSWTDTVIQATAAVSPSATGSASLFVTSTGFGSGFQSGGGSQPSEGGGNNGVQVVKPTITVTSSGFQITQGSPCTAGTTALVSPGGSTYSVPPLMPPLTYTISNLPASTNVTWQLLVNDGRQDKNPDIFTYNAVTEPATVAVSQNWQNGGNIGGAATLTASYSGNTLTTTFCIPGTNTVGSNLQPIVNTFAANFWGVLPAFKQESYGGSQFNIQGRPSTPLNTITPYGYPLSDGPSGWGYGISQISNEVGSADELWNWQSNIEIGMSVFANAELGADPFWSAQTSAYSTYFAAHSSPPAYGSDIESLCTFAPNLFGRTPSLSPHSYADAIILKRYNSAGTNHDYLAFNVPVDVGAPPHWIQTGSSPIAAWTQPGGASWTASGPPTANTWYIQRFAKNNTNYVSAVCQIGN